jgi:hypothetical protein
MNAYRLRLGIAVVVAALVVELSGILGSLLQGRGAPPTVSVSLLEAPVAEARIITRIISPGVSEVIQQRAGRVRVAGHIQCTAGQTLELRATVTQGATVAMGTATERCTGHPQPWVLYATTNDGAVLTSGWAAVQVWAHTVEDDATWQWDDVAKIVGPHK